MNWQNSWATPKAPEPESLISAELATRLNAEQLPINNDGLLMLWERTKKILETAKADEMEIRKTAVKVFVPNPTEGMNTVDLGGGFELKAQIKFNYNLAANDIVEKCLDEIAGTGNEGKFIADRLVSWTPNFLVTEYRKLQEEAEGGSVQAKQILVITEKMLTIKDAAPDLKIKEPRKKK